MKSLEQDLKELDSLINDPNHNLQDIQFLLNSTSHFSVKYIIARNYILPNTSPVISGAKELLSGDIIDNHLLKGTSIPELIKKAKDSYDKGLKATKLVDEFGDQLSGTIDDYTGKPVVEIIDTEKRIDTLKDLIKLYQLTKEDGVSTKQEPPHGRGLGRYIKKVYNSLVFEPENELPVDINDSYSNKLKHINQMRSMAGKALGKNQIQRFMNSIAQYFSTIKTTPQYSR